MGNFIIEPVNEADFASILEIENRAYSVPWNEQQMRDVFAQNVDRMKLMEGQNLIGYAFFQIILDEGHLLHITIDPKHQGRKLGKRLLEHIIQKAHDANLVTIFLEVRAGNTPALRLYEKSGFNQIGIRKGYYPCVINGREDAIVMAYSNPMMFFQTGEED